MPCIERFPAELHEAGQLGQYRADIDDHQVKARIDSDHQAEGERAIQTLMVCAKCQRLLKATELATPGVKRKSEMYYGSHATVADKRKPSATQGNSGISKVS